MARSSASVSPSRRTQYLWPAVLTLAFLTFAAPVVLLAADRPLVASVYAVVALAVLALLTALRRRHRRADSEAARLLTDVRERGEELMRRDADWRRHTQQGAALMRAEVGHVVQERLPAALAGRQDPGARHGADRLDEATAGLLDRLLTEVRDAVEHREESQRLALVELASRVQTSAHRIQASVTGISDRYPGDAELLESTMRVDHAATQQARHAQSLKVLCGEWPGQQWQKPLALVDAVRAASGRIVAFTRVEVSGDPDIGIAAPVVEPLIHLMAELLANATEYSPPSTAVPVTVRTVQRGAVIEVDDGGLGLDEYRLAEAREVVSGRRLLGVGDVGEIPQTGFAVVGRFADRHGFHVDLGPSPYGGVRAVVLIPTDVLEAIAPAGTPAAHTAEPPLARRATATGPSVPEQSTGSRAPEPAPAHPNPSATSGSDVTSGVGAGAPPSDGAAPTGVTGPTDPSGAGTAPAPGQARHAARNPAPTGRLPQRRSRRDAYLPTAEPAPAASAPPVTPEEAGDWMEQFFEGGRSVPDPRPGPHQGQGGSTPPTPDSAEGQA
ncbi:sensor histidine kinase [Streptomyces sp. AM 4-1-1]|uniref:ATP-binding protein n=1 Tax=Streptomyces sp. AM 4-1-1 TaxID=3028710 RepID=UPI0023B9B9D3|nr:ATP-binding protein [Streptomyces sp. AM 4-1-1]WEH36364.1 sensor histidine kinase [Streptomyces sp. AM 4-1-1]